MKPDALQKELQTIYSARFAGQAEYRTEIWKILASFFGTWIPADGATLDLGAGYCEFVNNVASTRKFAMDLNPDVRERAASGVAILLQDCSEPWPLAENALDTVFTSNFLEHLPDKDAVRRTLGQAFRCLKSGGRLIALGPNIRYLPGAYWDFFDHYVALTDLSLAEGLSNCGFSVEKRIGRFLPYTMSRGRQNPLWMLRLYLSIPVFWPLFGKQFLVVARKP